MNNFKKITLALALVAVIVSLTNIVEARINNPLSSAPFFTGTSSTATTTLAGGFAIESTGFVYDWFSNRVGIGTSKSEHELAIVDQLDGGNVDVLHLRNNGTSANTSVSLTFANSTGDSAGGTEGRISLIRTNTPSSGDGDFVFYNRRSAVNSETMRLNSSGNVGVGTSTPSARLDVYNGTNATRGLFVEGGSAGVPIAEFVRRSGASVGIKISGTGSDPQLIYANGTTDTWAMGFDVSNSSFNISENGSIGTSDRLVIKTGGSVGIGTSTPNNLFHVSAGASATTTVEFGDQYIATSKSCFNTKNNTGSAISFYFVGTTMVVENSRCK